MVKAAGVVEMEAAVAEEEPTATVVVEEKKIAVVEEEEWQHKSGEDDWPEEAVAPPLSDQFHTSSGLLYGTPLKTRKDIV